MPTVLVVDDALFMRVAIGNMLKEWGFDRLGRNISGEQTVAETDMIANCDKINELNDRG